MATAVFHAIHDEQPLLVEAGTGTGKTLSYLVPAILSGKRVVVSTGTRALQDQICDHDIPLVEQIVQRSFRCVVLKGIGNYLCMRKFEAFAAQQAQQHNLFPTAGNPVEHIRQWMAYTPVGDIADLSVAAGDSQLASEITTTAEQRLGPRCNFFDTCFVTNARRRAEKADIILVNHHLFFADLALRELHPGAKVLPHYDAVIFDECHMLEEVITEHMATTVSPTRFAALARDASQIAGAPTAPLLDGHRAVEGLPTSIERVAQTLFMEVARTLADGDRSIEDRVVMPAGLLSEEPCRKHWLVLDGLLDQLVQSLSDETPSQPGSGANHGTDPEHGLAERIAQRAQRLRDDLATIADGPIDASRAQWIERQGQSIQLRAAPVSVANMVRSFTQHNTPASIFTSATISSGGDFEFLRQRLGLTEDIANELRVESPFDYAQQALLYLPRDLPVPSDERFRGLCLERTKELIMMVGGCAFVLFTSHRALASAASVLRDALPYPILVQGDAPTATLVSQFVHNSPAVLLGTNSFWQGVDVPGPALSLVILDKLPFSAPGDPLVAARMASIEETHGDGFRDYLLPLAAMVLRQGFGRLIRRRDDRGIVAVMDKRIVTKQYGRLFLESLPPRLRRTASIEVLRRFWETHS